MKKWAPIAVLTILIISFCTLGASAQEKLAAKQVVNIAYNTGDAQSLDPHRAATTSDRTCAAVPSPVLTTTVNCSSFTRRFKPVRNRAAPTPPAKA